MSSNLLTFTDHQSVGLGVKSGYKKAFPIVPVGIRYHIHYLLPAGCFGSSTKATIYHNFTDVRSCVRRVWGHISKNTPMYMQVQCLPHTGCERKRTNARAKHSLWLDSLSFASSHNIRVSQTTSLAVKKGREATSGIQKIKKKKNIRALHGSLS